MDLFSKKKINWNIKEIVSETFYRTFLFFQVKNKKKKKQTTSQDGEDTEVMLKVLENQVTEVKDTMKDNIEKMHEREGKLEDLEYRATELAEQTVSLLIKVRVVNQSKTHFLMKRKSSNFRGNGWE